MATTTPQPTIETALSSLNAPSHTLSTLRTLHSAALAEPPYNSGDGQPVSVALTRYVALDPEKCALVYLLLRASAARRVVEAGTSFGVSTIWLALAVGQNVQAAVAAGAQGEAALGKVIATENEPTKALRATENWKSAGREEVERWIELREGDLRETLKSDLPEQVDFVLLDIWSPLALPALKLVQPRLKTGAMVVVDNVVVSAEEYRDLLAYLNDSGIGFRCTTAPYTGGLLIAVYMGQ
ncbi:O-methyltransferase [Phyllosticta citribraziliensis]|uniref:O-methyltransferase n=1 Tax=Phyllosticta citribraziliensis TaxID=989973 RepID=A0ABR1L641_9PEZI